MNSSQTSSDETIPNTFSQFRVTGLEEIIDQNETINEIVIAGAGFFDDGRQAWIAGGFEITRQALGGREISFGH
jgi:hypothetical protein